MNEIPPALLAIFRAEHAEHLEQIRSIVALGEELCGEAGKSQLEEAFRRAHSLKGAARAVDLPEIEGLAHHLETLFARVRDGSLELDQNAIRVIHQVLDSNEDCLAALDQCGMPDHVGASSQAIEELLGLAARGGEVPVVAPAAPERQAYTKPGGKAIEMVRLPADDLDRLVRSSGRMVTETRKQTEVTEELGALTRRIEEIEAEWNRLPGQSAATRDKVHALARLARTVRMRQAQHAWALRGSSEQLQQDVWIARMAPADDLYQGFRKMVRDLARDQEKEIHFELDGSGVRADRVVLQALKDPVMHLLRNAISHGIEPARERQRKGKPVAGSLTLHLAAQRGRLLVEVDDDGRGVDFAKVEQVAAAGGLMPRTGQEPGGQGLADMLFRPGFSTSTSITALSGRGMGLSVVYETVRRLQGEVELKPKPGPGASIALWVPLSLATQHLLLIGCEGQTFGIPTHGMERLYRIKLGQIEKLEGQPVVCVNERRIALFSLARVLQLGDGAKSFDGDLLPVVLLRSGTRAVALLVDRFVGECDALIQELGMPCPAHGNVSGGTILGDGSVVVVLNPAGLIQNCTPDSAGHTVKSARPAPPALAPSILVVDDSITARTLEKHILEAQGYRVRVALDGVEALHLLRAARSDLVITDIQMPRLDGFGLLEALKADPLLDHIPVIIVSSLERAEDQRRGLQLGADAYVTKGRFDQGELLAAVRQII